MYPYLRLAKAVWQARRQPPLALHETHVSQHRIWPWDLDPWVELNNGRTLTLFDLGRIPMSIRMGLADVVRRNGWGLTVAGNSTRYRRRVTAFTTLTQHARVIGWDHRFSYVEQSFWRGEECTAHMLLRSAVTSPAGIVPPATVLAALGHHAPSPPLPDWVAAWVQADATRPWPPMR